uniref:RING finger protein n=1 Tax=Rhizophora mucronata TaxID=61149 RepID=A0A2P2JVL9_RHIMU
MSAQTRGLRGCRRRKTLPDLNVPPSESREEGGSSTQAVSRAVEGRAPSVTPTTIDVEAFDDDVIESSPRAFAMAKDNAQRARGTNLVVDVDTGRTSRLSYRNRNKRRWVQSNQTIFNCDLYVNLESSSSSMRQNVLPLQTPLPLPPPPKEPTFNCSICMGPLVEETSTRCGHIFCKACIKTAIAAQAKCPTCRKRVTVKELIRVFLPATS